MEYNYTIYTYVRTCTDIEYMSVSDGPQTSHMEPQDRISKHPVEGIIPPLTE